MLEPPGDETDSRFSLCRSCFGRIAAGSPGDGGRGAVRGAPKSCYVCRGMMDCAESMSDVIMERARGYDFGTFSVGATLKPSVLDRDDHARSRMRARGAVSVKGELTRTLRRIISARTGRRPDTVDPDITILMDTRFGSCEIRSRHLVVEAMYVKRSRGMAQKMAPRGRCGGPGGADCGFGGKAQGSIEKAFSDHISDALGCGDLCFTWSGSEDASSRVLGNGRLFYVRVKNPRRRDITAEYGVKGVRFHRMRIVPRVPARMPVLRSQIRIVVNFPDGSPSDLAAIHGMAGDVRIEDSDGRQTTKIIHSARYRRLAGGRAQVSIDAEGGIPIKRFVDGDRVWPSISEALQARCECVRFDFMDIAYK